MYPFHANDSLGSESLSLGQMQTYEQRKEARCGHNWQKSYKKLHQDILQARRPQKFIVFTCKEEGYGCGGYGNRLGGITSLLFLSILTQRALLIDWDHGAPLERFLVPKGVQWNYSMENLKHFDSRIHYLGKKEHFKKTRSDVLKPWKTKLDFQAWLRQADLSSYFDHPVEKIVSNWNFANALLEKPFLEKNVNELPRKTNNSLVGCAFDFLFLKSKELETRLSAARHSLGLTKKVLKVGFHIRMGDVALHRGSNSNNLNYRAFFRCAQNLRDTLAQQTTGFQTDIKLFLATDDKDVKQYALMNYASDVVTLDIIPHHITSLRGRKHRPSGPVEGIFNVMLDHFLLSECDFLILSKSTFGLTAAELKFHPSQTVTFGHQMMHSNDHCGRVEVPSRSNSYVRT